jgi:hypothetical protein
MPGSIRLPKVFDVSVIRSESEPRNQGGLVYVRSTRSCIVAKIGRAVHSTVRT